VWILISAKAAGKARADPGCACFVPEPGQNIHPPLSKKKQWSPQNDWAFLSMLVLLCADFDLIQRAGAQVSGAPKEFGRPNLLDEIR
jgi:hypothetical protein